MISFHTIGDIAQMLLLHVLLSNYHLLLLWMNVIAHAECEPGSYYISDADPCETCQCGRNGKISGRCMQINCPPNNCGPRQIARRKSGSCCEFDCIYQGKCEELALILYSDSLTVIVFMRLTRFGHIFKYIFNILPIFIDSLQLSLLFLFSKNAHQENLTLCPITFAWNVCVETMVSPHLSACQRYATIPDAHPEKSNVQGLALVVNSTVLIQRQMVS